MQEDQRIKIIDILRGWAILIVVISNYTYFAYGPKGELVDEGFFSQSIQFLERYLFSAKGWTLLSILFGFGFGTIYSKIGNKSYFFFIKRMLVLFVFALLNSFIFLGDILRDYAILGLFLLLFIHLPKRKLFLISAILFIFIPFLTAYIYSIDQSYLTPKLEAIETLRTSYHWADVLQYNWLISYYTEVINLPYSVTVHYVMFTCMLFGLALQKHRFFDNLLEEKKNIKKTFIISLTSTLLLWGLFYLLDYLKIEYREYARLYYVIVIPTMLATGSGIIWLFISDKCNNLFSGFSYIGRMAFSNYLIQNIFTLFLFQGIGFRFFNHLPLYDYFLIAVGLYLLQIFFSKWWLQTRTYGPFEWLWRKLSNTKFN